MIEADLALEDANLLTCSNPANDCGLLRNASLAIRDGVIVWIGKTQDRGQQVSAAHVEQLNGRFVSPGLIDCHTHLVYGGHRAVEWQQRLGGATYEEIARVGGGIMSTVHATRAASESELLNSALRRAEKLLGEGVTTIEVKSGYGLSLDSELKMLRVGTELGKRVPIDVTTTFLGAHALPPEFANQANAYIELVCQEMLPAVVDECQAVDVFCERIAFDLQQTERVFSTAHELGIPIKIHAEQLSLTGGARLAAEMGALSADHLEYLDEPGVKAMKRAGTVAVLLPGAFYFLRERQRPPIDLLRRYEVPMAVATDHNPGSSPLTSLILALNMACTFFGLTVEEAFMGATNNAARALGYDDRGEISVGKLADLAVWDVNSLAEIPYRIGHNPCWQVFKRGQLVYSCEIY
ncbi:MAG TPA: imidazolonepropionase [Pirellulaceae bacterium]|nr:imidazolonepropionase [Pirellulaceae bacterium]HMO90977.1 imidazolonepropionase [Pirellulaceae bacterium]HMP68092.1 imidazolonepropionase [Pirellulaceae bacterium]